MVTTRRGLLATFTGFAAVSSWRIGWSETPPQGAHDTSPSTATASLRPERLASSLADVRCRAIASDHGNFRPDDVGGLSESQDFKRQPEASSASFPASTEDWLDPWQRLPRLPLVRDQIPNLGKDRLVEWYNAVLISSRIREGRQVGFIYGGGSEPGVWRQVYPVLLFTVPEDLANPDLTREPVYLLAHCLKRNAVRTFRLDCMSL